MKKRDRFGHFLPADAPDDRVYRTDDGPTGRATLGLPEPVRRKPYRKGTGKPRPGVFKRWKIELNLRPEDRAAYVPLVLGGATVETLRNWLSERGVRVSSHTVGRHREWLVRLHPNGAPSAPPPPPVTAIDAADADLSRRHGHTLADVAAWRGERLLTEKLRQLGAADASDVSPGDVAAIARALNGFLAARPQLDAMHAGRLERDEKAAKLAAERREFEIDGLRPEQRLAARVRLAMGLRPYIPNFPIHPHYNPATGGKPETIPPYVPPPGSPPLPEDVWAPPTNTPVSPAPTRPEPPDK